MDTPSLWVDLDAFDRNVETAERLASEHGKLLRPHVKTHRTPALALRQLTRSTTGVTCATVGEAEAMVAAGIGDVLIANELATAPKIERAAGLAGRAAVTVAVDAEEPARALSQAATAAGVSVGVLVDVDVGLGRCGVEDAAAAAALGRAVASMPGLELAGLMGYEGRLRATAEDRPQRGALALATLAEAKAALESAGLSVRVVSGAGTSTLREALRDPAITEIQAGTYALMEEDLAGLDLPFEPAASVAAAVISRRDGRAVVDAGRKTLGCDYGPPSAIDPGQRVVAVSEEHVVLDCDGPAPALGSIVRLRPSHVRTTFNLHDDVWLERAGQPPQAAPVSARGASR
jgi:D-serine deaminase-like pyridoxal phosphate-dependent protein